MYTTHTHLFLLPLPPTATPVRPSHKHKLLLQADHDTLPGRKAAAQTEVFALVFIVTMSMSPRDDDERDDGCIRIPVRGAQQTVEVYTEELPSDYNDVVDVLKAEIAPLDIWLRFAVSGYCRS